MQDSHLSVMGTSKTSKVALGVFSRRTRAGKVADAPRTTSSYSTARRAKQATSTANLPYGDGDETRHLKCQRARGTSHVSRRRSRSQSRSDAPFSSMASTDACSGARARLCSGTSAGVVRRSIAGMKQFGTESRMGRQSRYLPRTCAFRAIARGCTVNAETLPMHAHVIDLCTVSHAYLRSPPYSLI